MPRPSYVERISPHDLPPITHYATSFDLPMRGDVLQMDVPYGATHTRESYLDPRHPLKKGVDIIRGTIYHGTNSVDPLVNHAVNSDKVRSTAAKMAEQIESSEAIKTPVTPTDLAQKAALPPSFVEKRSHLRKSNVRKAKRHTHRNSPDVNNVKAEGVGHAWTADRKMTALLDKMTPWPQKNVGTMTLGVDLINKKDPMIKQYHENGEIDRRMKFFSNNPQGIRAAHTQRLLPRIG